MSDRLSSDIQDNERRKFGETPVGQKVFVRVNTDPTDPIPVTFSATTTTTPNIWNVSAPLAGIEYSQALSASVKRFLIKCRDTAQIQLGYGVGESSTDFITIPPGAVYEEKDILSSSLTLYFQTDQAGQTIEIVEWT